MENLTTEQLRAKARQYDNINTEGGEGYNPYSDEIDRRAMAKSAARPKTRSDRKYEILHELEIKDCSIARESGTYNQAEIDGLRAQLAEIEAEEEAEFLADWTREETMRRREEWNSFVRSFPVESNGRISVDNSRLIMERASEQGWSVDDLKRAIALHGLGAPK